MERQRVQADNESILANITEYVTETVKGPLYFSVLPTILRREKNRLIPREGEYSVLRGFGRLTGLFASIGYGMSAISTAPETLATPSLTPFSLLMTTTALSLLYEGGRALYQYQRGLDDPEQLTCAVCKDERPRAELFVCPSDGATADYSCAQAKESHEAICPTFACGEKLISHAALDKKRTALKERERPPYRDHSGFP